MEDFKAIYDTVLSRHRQEQTALRENFAGYFEAMNRCEYARAWLIAAARDDAMGQQQRRHAADIAKTLIRDLTLEAALKKDEAKKKQAMAVAESFRPCGDAVYKDMLNTWQESVGSAMRTAEDAAAVPDQDAMVGKLLRLMAMAGMRE